MITCDSTPTKSPAFLASQGRAYFFDLCTITHLTTSKITAAFITALGRASPASAVVDGQSGGAAHGALQCMTTSPQHPVSLQGSLAT